MSNDPSQSPLTQADLDRLLSHNLFKQTQSVKGILWMSFLRGVTFGFGSVLGATVVVYLVAQTLAQIEFITIVGDWINALLRELDGR